MRSLPSLNKTEYLDELHRFINRHKRLFVLTGAGCSTESGIPDYRDNNGDWKHRKPVQYQDFVRSESARRQYWVRSMAGWSLIAQAKPNGAHVALARLESAGLIHQLVTQNVDGLHQKAGSKNVIDLHGRLDTVGCLDCHKRISREMFQQELQDRNPAFKDLDATMAPDGDARMEGIDFNLFQIPACQECSGTMKPGVVFFGESVPQQRVDLAYTRLHESEALMVVGSSIMIFSGYRFCIAAKKQKKPIVAINLGRTRADADLTFKVELKCGKVLSEVVAQLGL